MSGGARAGSGRKPMPTALRIVTGYTRKDTMPKAEPKARRPSKKPEAPALLDEEGRKEWKRIIDEAYECGLVTAFDQTTLASYCQAYSAWVVVSKEWNKLVKSGRSVAVVPTANGIKRHPLMQSLFDASTRMVKYAAELGMTPSSRARVTAAPIPEGAGKARAKDYFSGPDEDESA